MKKLIIILSLFLPLLITSCSKDEPSPGLLRYNGHIVFERFHFDVSGTDATIVDYVGSETTVTVPATIDDYVNNEPVTYTVKHIGPRAFEGKPLKNITLPGTLKTIGDQAFNNCANLIDVQLPSSLTSIGIEAFNNCSSISKIQLPSSLTTIGSRAFQNTAIREVTIPSGTLGDNVFGNTKLEKLVLGSGVKNIPAREFSSDNLGGSTLISVTFSSGLNSIGDEAFARSALTAIDIPFVNTIGSSAFAESKNLSNVKLGNGTKSIGANAFKNCSKISSITFPSTLEYIGDYAFESTSINEVTLPTTNLGSLVFYNCPITTICLDSNVKEVSDNFIKKINNTNTLKEIIFSEGLVTIGERAFEDCTWITEVNIPSTVTTIKDRAFSTNLRLKKITIGSNVSYIGDKAFDQANATEVTFKGINPPEMIGYYTFTNAYCTVYVPQQSIEAYKQVLSHFLWGGHNEIVGY